MTHMIDAAPITEDGNFVAGSSPTVLTLKSVIAEIAPTNIPVLLVGESGTGKRMVAQLIHRLSPRAEEPFLKVACAAMNPERMSAELGLDPSRGRDAAGPVFFEEISELDPACQRSL